MIESLYKQYYRELLYWCSSMTDNVQTAEELVQEAFLRAMLHQELLENMKEYQCRSWLYQTVKHLYVDRLRHHHRETVSDELPETVNCPEVLDRVEWELLFESLPDQEGMIAALRYLEGYTSVQIGEILGIPPGTVRCKLSSARNHMKKALGGKRNVR